MILSEPTPFREALKRRAVQAIMPTNLNTEDLQSIPVDIRERSLFSARNNLDQVLRTLGDAVDRILEPQTRIGADGKPYTAGLDDAQARVMLRDQLNALGYTPPEGKAGTLQDLGSDERLDLVIRTNVEMAQGYGQWRQGQDEDVLDAFPAQELTRARASRVERDWPSRWADAAQASGDTDAAAMLAKHGRMVARKDSPIWISLSRFQQPYPPFDFNSGMDVSDVGYSEAVKLGVIKRGDKIEPQRRSFELPMQGLP